MIPVALYVRFLNGLVSNQAIIPRTGPKTGVCASDDFNQGQSGETLTSVSAGHIILKPTQPGESGRGDRTHDLLS